MERKKDEENIKFDLVALFLEAGEEKSPSGMAAIDEALKAAMKDGSAIFFSGNINDNRTEDIGARIYVSGGLDKFFVDLEKIGRSFENIYFISTRENEEEVRRMYLLRIPKIKQLKYCYRRKSKK